jgi:predicted dehydrogenase
MPDRIRVGVVGCGLVAQVMHLPYLRELTDRFEVAAVCDLAPQALDFASELFPAATRHEQWAELVAEELDAVFVLTPGSHAPIAIGAAQAGLHVFAEKPMCFSIAEGEEMIEAAEKAGIVLMVAYMKRFDPAYEELQRTLDRDALTFAQITTLESPIEPYSAHYPRSAKPVLGEALLAELIADDERRLAAAIEEADPVLRGLYRSVLLDGMVHELNAVRGLLGEPTTMHTARIAQDPTRVSVTASFGDIEAVFSWVDLPGISRYVQDWSFYGPDARSTLEFPSPMLRNMPTRLIHEGGEPGGISSWRTEHTVSYDEAFKRELVEFHEAVTEGRAPRTGAVDALRDVAWSQAIVRAHLGQSPIERPTALERDARSPV